MMMNAVKPQCKARNSKAVALACGFTMIELLVVIGIVALLVGLLIVGGRYIRQKAWKHLDEQRLGEIRTAIMSFNRDTGSYPLAVGTSGSPSYIVGSTGAENIAAALTGWYKGSTLNVYFQGGRQYGPYMPNDSALGSAAKTVGQAKGTSGLITFIDKRGYPILYYSVANPSNSTAWPGRFDPTQNSSIIADPLAGRVDLSTWQQTLTSASFVLVASGSDSGWGGAPSDHVIVSGP
jgi:prepilin-type N-terminal cleavage/methylation domain-containing protein